MVKVQMPMGGLSASGSIGGAITFATTKGRQYARQLVTPSNPRSAGQVATRAQMRFLSTIWASLTTPQQASWESLASQGNVSLINAFQRFNMNRWTQFQDPMRQPTEAAGTVPVMGALTATPGVRQVTLSQIITTANDIWGIVIARSTQTGYTPGKTDIVYVARYTASPVVVVDTPVTPGTYFYRVAGFTFGGARSAFIAQVQAIVA